MRRYLWASLLAYATSVTLLAAWWASQAWAYRRFFDTLMRGKHGYPVHFSGLSAVARDFGMPLSPWEALALRFADLPFWLLVLPAPAAFALSLGVAALARWQHPRSPRTVGPEAAVPLRWAWRGALASLLVGASAILMTWAFLRWRVLHPHPAPTVLLFAAQVAAAAVGSASGFWGAVRGPRKVVALLLMGIALTPLSLGGAVGVYAWAQWRQRLVPNNLPMDLAKMTGAALMRLEATAEYPNRLETGRLVMLYDRLADPRRDAEAMDRHLDRMERLLGGPLRAKVFWVRGPLRRLDLGGLSVHGIALGSGESPDDWDAGGTLDRHELAHAALDEYRPYDADPPYLLHEGWAEFQSGVGPVVLARRALEQRAADPSLGLRDMVTPGWYHRDDGPVYSLGGAFVDFLIRRDGVGRFVRLYNESREGRFGAVVREVYGVELDALEAEFWEDVRRQLGRPAGK